MIFGIGIALALFALATPHFHLDAEAFEPHCISCHSHQSIACDTHSKPDATPSRDYTEKISAKSQIKFAKATFTACNPRAPPRTNG